MLKKRSMFLLLSTFAISIYLQGISTAIAQATPISQEKAVIAQVKHTVEKKQMVINPACTEYWFTANAEPGVDLVDVMEKHGGKCGLDPQVHHRLFSVYVDQKTHQMATDNNDPDGNLTLLPPAE